MEKLEKDEKTIKLIRESKEILSKEEERKKKKKNTKKKKKLNIRERTGKKIEKEREEFDPKMNCLNKIILKNENKTAWNPSFSYYGRICGKKIYSSGKHQIKIKIDQYPNPKNERNLICLGVVKTENRQNLIKNNDWEKIYFFMTWWDKWQKKNQSLKIKIENQKKTEKIDLKNICLNKNDIFEISLDMDIRKISFKINERNLGGWENLPEKVNFFASLFGQMGKEKNQITII